MRSDVGAALAIAVEPCHHGLRVAVEIVARDDELAGLDAFFDAAGEESVAFVLEGEAGIGKSTLWRAGVETARARGLQVLWSRPSEPERELAHAGLYDLFEGVLEGVLPALSAPRRHALEMALLVEDAVHGSDPRTLGVAVRSALEVLVADGPIVVAVDDVQWFDRSSAGALAFALRRMQERPILLLLARRLGEGVEPSGLERAIEHVERLPVGPLGVKEIHRVVQVRLARTLPRPTLLRVHQVSGGNPFYAVELARLLSSEVDPLQPLRVPETLEGLLRARLEGLPPATRDALRISSTLGRLCANVVAAVGMAEDVLEPALSAHVIEPADGLFRFTHPLLASVLYQSMSASERRRAHERVAAIIHDPVERARHVALSTEGRDPDVAGAVEAAAAVASARGAPIAAAELLEHALQLTPPEALEDQRRRMIAAARAHFAAGESQRARALADELLAGASPGRQRAEALILLSDFARFGLGDDRSREALHEAAAHPALQALLHQRLAWELHFTDGVAAAERHARVSLELSERLGDEALRAGALAAFASIRLHAGEADALPLAEQAYELAITAAVDPQQRLSAGLHLASILIHSAEYERARAFVDTLYQEWGERDEGAAAQLLWRRGLVEFFARRFALAADFAEQAGEIWVQYAADESGELAANYWLLALIAAHRGDLDLARERAERGRAVVSDLVFLGALEGVLGLVAHWSGEGRTGIEHFAAAERARRAIGMSEPNTFEWRADYVEALLELGRTEEAVGVLADWEAAAIRLGRERVLAQITRCRGLVAAAGAELDEAQTLLEQAVAQHEAVGDPFGRARALLALGAVRRRARQKRAAREAIEAALAGFEELGAASWAEKARGELGHIGGRTRVEGLTPTERRVADLVAKGRTNREVAAALFVGERTVASHLTHIYTKLGVRSRTELAHMTK